MRRHSEARRDGTKRALFFLLACLLSSPVLAQQSAPINPRLPLPPPPPETIEPANVPWPLPFPTALPESLIPEMLPEPAFDLPETVQLAAGTSADVILETPMTTRVSTTGQRVVFRTQKPLRVTDDLEIPAGAAFVGRVTTAKKPGGFGRGGELRVKIEELELTGGETARVTARLEAADVDAQGRMRGDSSKGANILDLAQWSLGGTLIGSQVGGGKGAAIGAGAGALAALIIMMSRRGTDVYIEPGTPFMIVLDRPADLPGRAVYEAYEGHLAQERRAAARRAARDAQASAKDTSDESNSIPESERPVLKRRPKK
jgi:hypothetical protein